jgi:L-asparaginase
MASQPVLIIQGGAGGRFLAPERKKRVRKKILRILKAAHEKLVKTNSSIEAVTYAVQLLEDDPDFNAGTGSQLQADGQARLSASIMDGLRERFASVINIERIKNPILVAKVLLREKDRILAGEGALQFAKKMGLKAADIRTEAAMKRWKKHRGIGFDTVGACALDLKGILASATSTGGRGLEYPGRVSDSGMPVANYADARAAISATGIGEEIIDEGLAIKIATRVRDGLSLRQAFRKTFQEVRLNKRSIGAIGLDSKGHAAWTTTTEILIYGWKKGRRIELF